jgi:hypothetical protein
MCVSFSPPRLPLYGLNQGQIDHFLAAGVTTDAMIWPVPLLTTNGKRAADGRFEPDPDGPDWIVVEEPEDWIFWNVETGEMALDTGRAFALGEEITSQTGTCWFGSYLNIYDDPLAWLQNKRDGIVPTPGQWHLAFERLRDLPRVAVAPGLVEKYQAAMRPHMPDLAVLA